MVLINDQNNDEARNTWDTMNSLITTSIRGPFLRCAFILIALVLACLAFLPEAGAVVPAPDGGYPGGNTAEGQNALLSLTTATNNTAVGWFSLKSDTTGGLKVLCELFAGLGNDPFVIAECVATPLLTEPLIADLPSSFFPRQDCPR